MALGPKQMREYNKRISNTKEAALTEERRRALSFVKVIADWAEKIIDKKIPSTSGKRVEVTWADMERAFGYGETMRLVVERAERELQEILEKRYLPQGWGGVLVGSCYITIYMD